MNKIKQNKINYYYSYNELKLKVKEFNIKSKIEYFKIYKKLMGDNGIKAPMNPNKFHNYKHEWDGWDEFLDKNKYYSYQELKVIVNNVGIKSNKEYLKRYKELTNEHGVKAPDKPYRFYKGEWSNWYDFIPERITKKQKNSNKYYKFEDLKEIVRKNKIYTSFQYWDKYKTLSSNGLEAPCNPYIYYGDECNSWKDLLYSENRSTRYFIEYEELKRIVQSLNIKTQEEYRKKYKDIINKNGLKAPAQPETIYSESEWVGYGEFLGTGVISPINREFLDFENARAWVRALNLKCCSDWEILKNLPKNIPRNPRIVYKNKGWVNKFDWLGIDNNRISKGESIIMGFLDNLNIKYEYNKSINGCKNVLKLRFDFIISNKNIYIEYDGEQHYKPIDYFGGEEHLNEVQKRDEIKNNFCLDNNIKLIRIPYYLDSEEIYKILEKEILN